MERETNIFTAFILHLHPRKVRTETLRFTLSFGLGGMATVLVATLMVTGVMQLISYSPHANSSYVSIQQMYEIGNFAGFIRNIHYWSGNILVAVAALHLLRVFLTGALRGIRKYNWVLGIVLFLTVLSANFTGYLLPWDQRSFWAVTIFTNMASYVPFAGDWLVETLRGGSEVGPPTLVNFFAIHIGVMPIFLSILLVHHFWLIRKAGGLAVENPTPVSEHSMISTVPYLIRREAATGLTLLAAVCLMATFFDAPLGLMANAGESPNPVKATWYFMGLQELLLHFHPSFAICIIPLLMLFSFTVIPFCHNAVLPSGVWFGGKHGNSLAFWSFIFGFFVMFILIVLDDAIFRGSSIMVAESTWLSRGLLPLLFISAFYLMLLRLLTQKSRYTRAEAVMSMAMIAVGSILALTVTGILFRGPGMALNFLIS